MLRLRGRPSDAIPATPDWPNWKISVAFVALAALLGFGIGIPISTLLSGPPGAAGAGGNGLAAPVPTASRGSSGPSGSGGSAAHPGDAAPGSPGGGKAAGSPVAAAGGAPAAGTQAGDRAPGVPPPAPKPAPLTASFTVLEQTGPLGLVGYRVQVTIRNPGEVTVSGWTVRFRFPAGELVTESTGAGYRPDGTMATFTPAGNAVPAHGIAQFTFTVGGVVTGPPYGCTIDDRACG